MIILILITLYQTLHSVKLSSTIIYLCFKINKKNILHYPVRDPKTRWTKFDQKWIKLANNDAGTQYILNLLE